MVGRLQLSLVFVVLYGYLLALLFCVGFVALFKAFRFVPFLALFDPEEGKAGVVVTFLAMMELIKESLLDIVQTEAFAPIHVKAKVVSDESTEPAEFE